MLKRAKNLNRLANSRPAKTCIPSKIELNEVYSSPIFHNPQKWVSQPRLISENERLDSYKSLDLSIMAELLSSPPRMVHATRTIVPRDLLVPTKVSELPYDTSESNDLPETDKTEVKGSVKKRKKKKDLKFIISPYHPEERKIPEDPVTYYPKLISIFEQYGADATPDKNGNVPLEKFSMNFSAFSSQIKIDTIGWNLNTHKVIEKLETKQVELFLSVLSTQKNQNNTEKILLVDSEKEPTVFFSTKYDSIIINTAKMKQHNPELVSKIYQAVPQKHIPISKETMPFLTRFISYAMFLS